jgi:hypothetical protein
MSAKTITITEEAYERLKSRKSENQSGFVDFLQADPGIYFICDTSSCIQTILSFRSSFKKYLGKIAFSII